MIIGEPFAGMPVQLAARVLPLERRNLDTDETETIHGIVLQGTLYLSQWAFDELQRVSGVSRSGSAA